MSRRNRRAASAANDDSGDSDTDSTHSGASTAAGRDRETVVEDPGFVLAGIMVELEAKRRQTREEALKTLRRTLAKRVLPAAVYDRQETLLAMLTRCVRTGSGQERALAATCIGLVFIQQCDSERLFLDTVPALTKVIRDDGESNAALSIAIGCLLACDDPSEVKTIIGVLHESVLKGGRKLNTAEFLGNVLRALSLLYTHRVLSGTTLIEMMQKCCEKVVTLLRHESTMVRLAVGEYLGVARAVGFDFGIEVVEELTLEELREQRALEGSDDDSGDEADESDLESAFGDDTEYDLLESIRALSRDSSRRRSKQELRVQRKMFRDLLETFEHGRKPVERLEFRRQECVFRGWIERVRLNSMRQMLGDGTHAHFEDSLVVRRLFNLGRPVVLINARDQSTDGQSSSTSADVRSVVVTKRATAAGGIAVKSARQKSRGHSRDVKRSAQAL